MSASQPIKRLQQCIDSLESRQLPIASNMTTLTHTLKESFGSTEVPEYWRLSAKASMSSRKTQIKVFSSSSSIDSIIVKALSTTFPVSPKYWLNIAWVSNSTSLQTGKVSFKRMDNCWAKARQRLVFPQPGGP